MGHTYTSNLYHIVFSTKLRQSFHPDIRERLHSYLGGAARANGFEALRVGGPTDHVHILLKMPPTLALSKAVQLIKTASSKWIHETFPTQRSFEWQEGYAAFTVSESQKPKVIEYIQNQKEHHRKQRFEDEFVALLRKHDIAFDSKYVLG
jgi:putative transposase